MTDTKEPMTSRERVGMVLLVILLICGGVSVANGNFDFGPSGTTGYDDPGVCSRSAPQDC